MYLDQIKSKSHYEVRTKYNITKKDSCQMLWRSRSLFTYVAFNGRPDVERHKLRTLKPNDSAVLSKLGSAYTDVKTALYFKFERKG